MVPPDKQLELNRIYEQQHDLVNSVIILTVMNALDQDTFPIIEDNRYHSLENSETDQSSHPGDRIIVTKDLKWRLDTYRRFLHEYVDKIFNESSKAPRH
ncbi:unnamed protein product [Rhizophagus irregularis]|nr:unnamed protein product [Rhizophagus irregularis]